MRITLTQALIMVILTSLVAAAPLNGQGILDRKVSLDVNNAEIKSILSEIEKQTSVIFTYRSKLIKASKRVSLKVSDARLSEVLEELFDPGISYLAMDDEEEIVLRPNPNSDAADDVSLLYSISLTGKVTDETGQALPGVSVLEKGTTNGTATDNEGRFSLNVRDDKSIVIFSFIGYASQEVIVGSQTELSIGLQPDAKSLEEVVVVGYGVQKKSDITGSLTSISPKEFASQPVNRLDQILQGRASGVQVTNVGGAPGGAVRIRVKRSELHIG